MKTFEHGGNIHKAKRENSKKEILDFSANINPLGAPEWLRPLVSRELSNIIHYPDPEYTELTGIIAKKHNVDKDQVVVGNGTSEILYFFMQCAKKNLRMQRVLLPVPSYVDYYRTAELAEFDIVTIPLREDRNFLPDFEELNKIAQPKDVLILGTPNNPTGAMPNKEEFNIFVKNNPQLTVLLDKAFIDFAPNLELDRDTYFPASSYKNFYSKNICSLNSMTKFYGVPGLRIGYGIFPSKVAEKIKESMPTWSLNSLAESFAIKALQDDDENRFYQENSIRMCKELRQDCIKQLEDLDAIKLYPSEANYLFFKIKEGYENLADYCERNSILIRRCDNYVGLKSPHLFFRVAVRTKEENQRLIATLYQFFCDNKSGAKKQKYINGKRRTPAIMFQGTCSDAGKSIITAALCRVLYQDGVAVAPFKAQNMSLNSFVTLQGAEMGRAQVVQAQAARLDPSCCMNPVLLKPNSDTGSQVIVAGKAVGNMSVQEYNKAKPEIWKKVCSCYDSLAEKYDALVLEGAGSPGEINLKQDDIVNMKMAHYANAPVILIGDIDRGGVYSSFIGIMETLFEWERRLVAGFFVNKFRGDVSLLDAAHKAIEFQCGKPVVGVLEWQKNLGLPEEDSVSFKKGLFQGNAVEREKKDIEIAVINFPHISNFTDIEPFLNEPDVFLNIVNRPEELGRPDAIIIPGSKNVLHDLNFLHEEGLFQAIYSAIENGSEIVGICGGYQMLGKAIHDPYSVESAISKKNKVVTLCSDNLNKGAVGFGFFEMDTVIEERKQLLRKTGIHSSSGKKIFGYEIHHGVSTIGKDNREDALLLFDDGSSCGYHHKTMNIWGSYLHGIFDSDEFRRYFIDTLRRRKGLMAIEKVVAPYDLENAFDRLADNFRASVNMDHIYCLLGL